MRVSPNADDQEIARTVYSEFTQKPGSAHIASEFALAGLSALLNKLKPVSVLEFGSGIGTITNLLLSHPVGIEKVVTFEQNEFCLRHLRANLPSDADDRVRILTTHEEVHELQENFDLIVLDGGGTDDRERQFDLLRDGTVVFFEGVQRENRDALVDALAGRGLACELTNNRPPHRKWLTVRLQDRRFLGVQIPKVRVFHKLKGCWVGEVKETQVTVQRAAASTLRSDRIVEAHETQRS